MEMDSSVDFLTEVASVLDVWRDLFIDLRVVSL